VEWTQTLKPGSSATLEVPSLLAHVSAHFKRYGTDINPQLTVLRYSQLAILPGTDYEMLMERRDCLVPMITAFLDAPMPAPTTVD
jgi:hypothetical protein